MAKHKYSSEEIAEWRKTHGSFFYFNKDDSNFVIPKPYGFGRTYNWANPISWVIVAALIAFLVWALYFKTPVT
jgi:uncharacterized membrane protein